MLSRSSEFENDELPIVSICIITDRSRCPPNFTPILKAHDDGSDADLWKEGFGLFFGRTLRYIAVNRMVPENGTHEVITDIAIISEKEAVPTNFICIDYTVDTKDRALRKKFICVRFTQRNDAIDAVTDIIVLNKSKGPPKGYVSAGDVDGVLICFKVTTIPQTYGIKQNIPSSTNVNSPMYPSLNGDFLNDLSQGVSSPLNLRSQFGTHCGLDGVPFKLNPRFESMSSNANLNASTHDPNLNVNLNSFDYNFRLERSILGQQ